MAEQQQNNQVVQPYPTQYSQQSNQYYQTQPMRGQNSGLAFHPQQAQQFAQQQRMIQPKKKTSLTIAIAAIIIVIIAALSYFMFFGKQAEATSAILIDDFRFCNSVDDSFNCDENTAATFKVGEDVWFVLKVYGHENKKVDNKYLVHIIESITTLDPDYERVGVMTGVLQTIQKEYDSKSNVLTLKTKLETTRSYQIGKYTLSIVVEDKLGQKASSMIKEFTLE